MIDGSGRIPYKISEAASVGPGMIYKFPRMNSLVNLEQRVFLSAILLGGSLTDYYNVIDRNYNMGSGYSIKNNTILDFGRYGMFALNMHLYQIFTWKDVKVFMLGQYILMHSVIYRTELLRQCNFELPKHTFYVDNIFVFQPLPYVKTMYYLDVNFYRYFIGRTDQSVNETVMIGRIDQQIRVTKLMLDYYENSRITSHKLRHYMVRYLEIMMVSVPFSPSSPEPMKIWLRRRNYGNL